METQDGTVLLSVGRYLAAANRIVQAWYVDSGQGSIGCFGARFSGHSMDCAASDSFC